MDVVRHTFPVKRWLALSLTVLLVHLGVLQSLPIGLGPSTRQVDAPQTFTTRAVTPVTPITPVPAKARPKHAQSTPRAPARTAPVPTAAPPLAEASSLAVPDIPAEPAPVSAQAAAERPADAASVPASAEPVPLEPAAAVPTQEPEVPAPAAADAPQTLPKQPQALDVSAESLSGSTRLLYAVKTSKFPISLRGELEWRNQGSSYSARLRYNVFGQTRMQTSRGQLTDKGLTPERFADKYRSELAAHFNYTEQKITFSANTPDARLLPGAQDRLSVLIQLGAVIATAPQRYPVGTTLMLQTVGSRAADLWLFTVGNLEPLVLPGGTVQGLKLERQPRELYDQKVEVWLSPELSYLPARIRITETNGDNIDQQWSGTESADGAEETQ